MPKDPHIGNCELCKQTAELRKSHLMPASLYPKNVKVRMQFASRGAVSDVGDEIVAYALCPACESRFDRLGESEVLRHIAPKATKSYPLHEKLRLAVPRDNYGGAARFAGYDVGLDMDRFAYFAMSVVWRRAAIDWNAFHGERLPGAPLGDFQEQIRQFLLQDNAPLPSDMVVVVIVCSDSESRRVWLPPEPEVEENCINFRFLVRGVFFRVLIGHQMPSFYRDYCCTSAFKTLLYGDASHRMPEVMAMFDNSIAAKR